MSERVVYSLKLKDREIAYTVEHPVTGSDFEISFADELAIELNKAQTQIAQLEKALFASDDRLVNRSKSLNGEIAELKRQLENQKMKTIEAQNRV